MRKLNLFLFFNLFSTLLFSQEKEISINSKLKFDKNNYLIKEASINGKNIKDCSFENIIYVGKPVDIAYQSMNVYIPEEYFKNESIGKYNSETAPIFLPNSVGGYMPGKIEKPDLKKDGSPNSILYALSKGYVVVSPALRGRTLTDKEGLYTGKAPAGIVDLKAVVRYLHYNDKDMPGNAEKIISNGTSAGGALSALLGASANSKDYNKYLDEIGAVEGRDNIYAVSSYCPITNLENADIAYEWQFNGINNYSKMIITRNTSSEEFNDRSLKHSIQKGKLNKNEIEISNILKPLFSIYLNSLSLKDENGNTLYLDEEGNGSFKNYLSTMLKDSANKAISEGKDLRNEEYLIFENSKVVSADWDKFIKSGDRMKTPPAFDSFNLDSGENNLFGTKIVDNKHFANFYKEKFSEEKADSNIIKLMNPMNYIENPESPKYWRIRHGIIDKDTSLAIPVILSLKLKNIGKKVDFFSPWGQGHAGDYDLEELFDWIDEIVNK